MSTYLGRIKGKDKFIEVTKFFGGEEYDICVQFTQDTGYIQISAAQLKNLIPILQKHIINENCNSNDVFEYDDELIETFIDCPICGSKNCMEWKEYDKTVEINQKSFIISNLKGIFCKECKEGFLNKESKDKFYQSLIELGIIQKKVYCSNCSYLYLRYFDESCVKYECINESNLKFKDTWKERLTYYISSPKKLNKKNDCKNYKKHNEN